VPCCVGKRRSLGGGAKESFKTFTKCLWFVMCMGGVYQGLGGAKPPMGPGKSKIGLISEKITKTMQLTHNVNNSGTFIPILCCEIYQSVYFLAVMRSPICGNNGARL